MISSSERASEWLAELMDFDINGTTACENFEGVIDCSSIFNATMSTTSLEFYHAYMSAILSIGLALLIVVITIGIMFIYGGVYHRRKSLQYSGGDVPIKYD